MVCGVWRRIGRIADDASSIVRDGANPTDPATKWRGTRSPGWSETEPWVVIGF